MLAVEPDLSQLTDAVNNQGRSPLDYLIAIGIFATFLLLGRMIQILTKRLINKTDADSLLGSLIGRTTNYLLVTFGIIYSLDKLGVAIGPVLGALGIAGIAVAFAFQNILENFVAGVILQIQRPFSSGDEIIAAGHEGAIRSVDVRTITIESPDGETIIIPSAEVIKNPIVNHNIKNRRRSSLEVGVAYGSDLENVSRVVFDALSGIDDVFDQPKPEVLVHTFGESSVNISIRYWHKPSIADHWHTQHEVASAVHSAFTAHEIEIPFPQQVLRLPSPDS